MPLLTNMAAGGTIVGILVEFMQVVCVGLGAAMWGLIGILTGMAEGADTSVWSIREVIFNRSSLTTASFFRTDSFNIGLSKDVNYSAGIVPQIFAQVTNFYYIMRNISIAILLFILLYIGIRMAISTVASDEAKYKKMLGNWAVSMSLIFVLQFIMIVTFYINNRLVDVLYNFSDEVSFLDFTKLMIQATVPVVGIGEAVVFLMMMGMELTFVLMYIKRVITLAFLIVISPLITITYSLDKIGDNKSQALDTWLKEFIFTVLIQPFHCIIYIVLIQTAIDGISKFDGIIPGRSLGAAVIYIIMLKFMKDAEEIVRKIFGIRSDSMPGFKGMGVMALGVMSKLGSSAGKVGGSGSKGSSKDKKMPDLKKEQKGQSSNPGGNSGGNPEGNSRRNTGGNPVVEEPDEPEGNSRRNTGGDPGGNPGGDPGGNPGGNSRRNSGENSGAISKYGRELGGMLNRMGGARGLARKGAKAGASLAGFGFGLGMTGEIDQAIAFSSIAGSASEKIDDTIQDLQENKKLKDNEEVFKEKINNYMEEKIIGDGTFENEQQAGDYVNDLFKKYSNNELVMKDLSEEDRALVDLYDDMDNGEDDTNEMLKGLIKQVAKEREKNRNN